MHLNVTDVIIILKNVPYMMNEKEFAVWNIYLIASNHIVVYFNPAKSKILAKSCSSRVKTSEIP